MARWLEGMAGFNYEVVHRPGKQQCNADALSRGQCRQCGLDFSCTAFEKEEEVMCGPIRISEIFRKQIPISGLPWSG